MGGDYSRMVDELYKEYNVNKDKAYNPCTIVKILLADDDVLSNSALRRMIEQDAKYQVTNCFNGVEVRPEMAIDRRSVGLDPVRRKRGRIQSGHPRLQHASTKRS
jgi:hypothetical protein